MLIKSILVGLVYFIFRIDFLTGTTHLSRPLVIGTIVGAVLGDLQSGIIIGANLEMAYLGVVSIGMAALPDYVTGSILGTAFAINSGAGVEAALGLGIPIATAMMAIDPIKCSLELIIVHMLDKKAENADPKGYKAVYYVGGIISSLISCALISMAFYFGADMVINLIESIPEVIFNGMNIALGLIPAVGFVLLLRQMADKKLIPFFFIGYFISRVFGLSSITIAVFAILVAWIIVFNEKEGTSQDDNGGELDEF